MIRLTILGNNSAIPAHDRHPTAQIIEIREQLFLADCGEGTQIQMQRYGIKRRRINYIFISHLHGDHYFGLIGLLTSMGLLGRLSPLQLFGPPQLKEIIDLQLAVASTVLPYEIQFTPIEDKEAKVLVDTPHYSVSCFPVEHRIPCHGFLFTLKNNGRKLLPEKCREYEIPAAFYSYLKQGEDYTRRDGYVVKNDWVTSDAAPDKRYAYCADTLYTESFLEHIKGVDALYHESTYLDDNRDRAFDRFHSTAAQAAGLAQKAGAKRLLLGHFSSKYLDLLPFYSEASAIFPDVAVTTEGTTYEI
jgi:ribonuclease Z